MPPKDNSEEDYTNMNYARIAHPKILYISLIRLFQPPKPVNVARITHFSRENLREALKLKFLAYG